MWEARIGPRNTAPEMAVRRLAHRLGYRFRLHRKDLPGRPDLVFPQYRLAIFVHGCFRHRHEACTNSTMPKSRTGFWSEKFSATVARDRRNIEALHALGWRTRAVQFSDVNIQDDSGRGCIALDESARVGKSLNPCRAPSATERLPWSRFPAPRLVTAWGMSPIRDACAQGKRYPLPYLLLFTVLALMSGARAAAKAPATRRRRGEWMSAQRDNNRSTQRNRPLVAVTGSGSAAAAAKSGIIRLRRGGRYLLTGR